MPDIYAQSADGEWHQFPEGTPKAVIDKAMKTYAANQQMDRSRAGTAPDVMGEWDSSSLPGLLGIAGGLMTEGASIPLQFAAGLVPGAARFVQEKLKGASTGDAMKRGAVSTITEGVGPTAIAHGMSLFAKPTVAVSMVGRAPRGQVGDVADTILSEGIRTPGQAADAAKMAAQDVERIGLKESAERAVEPLRAKALPPATRTETILAGEPPATWEPVFDADGKLKEWIPSNKPVTTPPGEIPTFDKLQNRPGTATLVTKPGGGDVYGPNPPFEYKYNKAPGRQAILEAPDLPDTTPGPGTITRETVDQPSPVPPNQEPPSISPAMEAAKARADALATTSDAMNKYKPPHLPDLIDYGTLGMGYGFHHPGIAIALDLLRHAARNPTIAATAGQAFKNAPNTVPTLLRMAQDPDTQRNMAQFLASFLVDK